MLNNLFASRFWQKTHSLVVVQMINFNFRKSDIQSLIFGHISFAVFISNQEMILVDSGADLTFAGHEIEDFVHLFLGHIVPHLSRDANGTPVDANIIHYGTYLDDVKHFFDATFADIRENFVSSSELNDFGHQLGALLNFPHRILLVETILHIVVYEFCTSSDKDIGVIHIS